MVKLLKLKPVTLLAVGHAVLACAVAFHLVTLDGAQLVAVEGLFAALGYGSAQLVTANVRLSADTLADAKATGWGPLRDGWSGDV